MQTTIIVGAVLVGLWVALTQNAGAANIILGAVVAMIIMAFMGRAEGERSALRIFFNIIYYIVRLHWDLLISSCRVAWDVLTPTHQSTPRVIRFPLRIRGDAQITALASSITLTPGSLTIDIDDKGEEMLIHLLYSETDEAGIAEIRELEDRLIACLPPKSKEALALGEAP